MNEEDFRERGPESVRRFWIMITASNTIIRAASILGSLAPCPALSCDPQTSRYHRPHFWGQETEAKEIK